MTIDQQMTGNDPTDGPATPASGGSTGKRTATVGLAIGLLGGAAAGMVIGVPGLSSAASDSPAVLEQTDPTDPTETIDTTGTTETTDPTDTERAEAVQAEATERLRESLQDLVDDGTISAEQADAVAAHLVENRPDRGRFGDHEGRGPGRGAGHLPGLGGPGHGRFGSPFDGEVLETLGIDAATLRAGLEDGKSLAEIAAEQGVEVQTLIDELVAEGSERIDEAVTNGRLDADQAADRKAELESRITEMVNRSREN
jgi:polyhydroxyalkanoate synthesis regulator phasin